MQTYSCKVRLSGSLYNEVTKIGVTVPEIVLLRYIHGHMPGQDDEAGGVDETVVTDIKPTGEIERTDAQERARLANLYNPALKRFEESGVKNINGVFGVGQPLPQVIEGIEKGVVVPEKKPRRTRKSKAQKTEPTTPDTDEDTQDEPEKVAAAGGGIDDLV